MTRRPYTPDQDARRKLQGESTRELHRLGFIEKDRHSYRFPDDGSLRALHDSASEESFRFGDDDGGWRLWKRFRRMCCARDIPPQGWVAERVVREEGRELTKATVTRKLGKDAANQCWPRIAELAGVECVTVSERRSGTYEQFVDLIPYAVRDVVSAAIEYEIDKESGYLKADRPQKFSNFCPSLYGFVPQTFCAEKVGELCSQKTGRKVDGDGDALDVCVLTEKDISHGDVIVKAVPIGGFRMIDKGQAGDHDRAGREAAIAGMIVSP